MEIITPRPDLEQVIQLYGSFLPDYDYLMGNFGANRGWIRFSPRLHELTIWLKCRNYPELYQDEVRIQTALLRAFIDNDQENKQFVSDLSSHTLIEQSVLLNQFIKDAHQIGQLIDENAQHLDDLDWSPSGQAKARREWEKLTLEEQKQALRCGQYLLMSGLASFFNFIALMVHGRKLTQLVLSQSCNVG